MSLFTSPLLRGPQDLGDQFSFEEDTGALQSILNNQGNPSLLWRARLVRWFHSRDHSRPVPRGNQHADFDPGKNCPEFCEEAGKPAGVLRDRRWSGLLQEESTGRLCLQAQDSAAPATVIREEDRTGKQQGQRGEPVDACEITFLQQEGKGGIG